MNSKIRQSERNAREALTATARVDDNSNSAKVDNIVTDVFNTSIEDALVLSDEERELATVEFHTSTPDLTPEQDAELQAALESLRRGEGIPMAEARQYLATRLAR